MRADTSPQRERQSHSRFKSYPQFTCPGTSEPIVACDPARARLETAPLARGNELVDPCLRQLEDKAPSRAEGEQLSCHLQPLAAEALGSGQLGSVDARVLGERGSETREPRLGIRRGTSPCRHARPRSSRSSAPSAAWLS